MTARGKWDRRSWMREVKRRWMTSGLGKDPDYEVASKLGRTRQAACLARKRLGLPCPQVDRVVGRLRAARRYLAAGIGERKDADVAAVLGVTRQAVAWFRKALGIAPWRGTK